MAVGSPGATPFGGHAGEALCVAFSPDGTTLASGGTDGLVRLWNTASHAETGHLVGHTGDVHALAWNPDGSAIATGGADHTVRTWDTSSGRQIGQFARHSHPVRHVAWNSDGTILASGAGSVRLWDVASGHQARQLTRHDGSVTAVAWSPDGAMLAAANARSKGSIRFWRVADEQYADVSTGHAGMLLTIAWQPGGTVVATGDDRGDLRLIDDVLRPGPRRSASLRDDQASVREIVWKADGTMFAVVAGGVGVEFWDAAGERQERPLPAAQRWINAVTWHPGGTALAFASDDGTISLRDAASGERVGLLTGHTSPVRAIAWSPDGTTIATGSAEGNVRLWDAVTGQEAGLLADSYRGPGQIAWSPDGATLATSSVDSVRLWDVGTGRQIWRSSGVRGLRGTLAWRPDGSSLTAMGNDDAEALLDAATGRCIQQLPRENGWTLGFAWSFDGTSVSSASSVGIRRWDAAVGQMLQMVRWGFQQSIGGLFPFSAGEWSPDGTMIAVWNDLRRSSAKDSDYGSVWLCDTATGKPLRRLAGHNGEVFASAWNPAGTIIATAGSDAAICLWDPATGQLFRQLTGHVGPVQALAWSPDGSTLISGGDDCTIRIWNPRNGAQVNGTGFGAARVPPRQLAGVRSDSPSDTDLLGVGDDVETLAELIAATDTRPPLAIALIGDWGTGKSSVLLQLEKHIQLLSDRARNNPGLTAWAETVRQVRFNAWNYSDEQLWAGLVSHLFEVLASPRAPEAGGENGEEQAAADPAQARAQRAKLEAELDRKQRARDRLDAALKQAEAMAQPAGRLAALRSPLYAARVLSTVARQGVHDLSGGLAVVLAWVVLGGAAYLAWRYAHGWVAPVATAVAVVAPPVALVAGKVQTFQAFIKGQRGDLTARQQLYERDIKSLRDQLVLADAAELLARFLTERGGDGVYREYRGLLGQVRVDLERLAAKLSAARGQWERSGRTGPPPLERIVLYIDDLDRCPPRRVVEVLEAVHLMLALDLFVVVVAVDARWLIRSLEHHHHELFERGHEDGDASATPVDYLDKIFQIPFTLPPPTPEATADYLRSLLPEPVPQPAPVAASPAPATGDQANGAVGRARQAPPAPAPAGDGIVVAPAAPAGAGLGSAGPARPAAALPEPATGEPEPRQFPDGAGDGDADADAVTATADTAARTVPAREGTGGGDHEVGEGAIAGIVELRPLGLQVTQAEVDFLARLGGLLPTPRAAKRLVNLYRLVRIGVPSGRLGEFTGDESGGPYQAVQTLLALLVGHPEFARQVFGAILGYGEAPGVGGHDLVAVVEEVAERSGEPQPFRILYSILLKLREETPSAVSLAECRRWCPYLARFSFYTRDLAGSGAHQETGWPRRLPSHPASFSAALKSALSESIDSSFAKIIASRALAPARTRPRSTMSPGPRRPEQTRSQRRGSPP